MSIIGFIWVCCFLAILNIGGAVLAVSGVMGRKPWLVLAGIVLLVVAIQFDAQAIGCMTGPCVPPLS